MVDGVVAGPTVWAATPRQVLRARPHPDGGLQVEAGDDVAGWARVDDDVVGLARTVTRQLAADPAGTARFARDAVALAEVDVRGAGPVEAVLRATYPLLGAVGPWPVPALPGSLPATLQPAFRQRDPRSAARRLFGRRATRPVTRALAGALTSPSGTIDLFRLTVAVAVAGRLEPDHLVRVLQVPGEVTDDRDPVAGRDADALVGVLAGLPTRRVLQLVVAACASGDDRARVRHLIDATRRGLPVDLSDARTWRAASTALALADPDVDAALPGTHPVPPAPDHPDWLLRPARTGRDLLRLSRQLDNCLDTYVGRLAPFERIVEVVDRRAGRPAFAIHLRRGHIVQFRGVRNQVPDAAVRREVVDLLDQHDRFPAPGDATRVDVPDDDLARLAGRWLAGDPRDPIDWTEVATAFWLAGLLRELPDPARVAGERVVADLAELAVAGRLHEAPRRRRSLRDLEAADRRLRPHATPRTRSGQQRRAMLGALQAAARRLAGPAGIRSGGDH